MFQEHLGKTIEVYIDDILVKSVQAGDHIQHLSDTFQILRKFNMKLNPEKYAFGVASGKFWGFLVSNRGIEVNPAQIKAIDEIPDILTSKKEVQRLTSRIAALGRFISKSSEKRFKFFSVLKKQNQFEWTNECQQALKNLKASLSNPPLLAKPKDGERLLIYLAVSEMAVSAVLVRENKDFNAGIVPEAKKELQVFTGSNPGNWTLFIDGSSNVKGAGLGIVLIPPSGEIIRQAIKYYPITNNEAEYKVVIAGLELARELGIERVIIKSESHLVVNQMQGTYITSEYGILPEDKKRSQSLQRKVAHYCLVRGNIYRKMFGGPLARCLGPSQIEYVMREVHEGHCENHAGGRSLVKTLIRAGFYWPKIEEDAESFVSK
ncbi:uncharacterized protein [Nicotiana tomentosiformis]|uniref:uncharacterized protein n=1 Tax=Nicotiana tomentosiformis TaxID=4098 RepID=UPI00051BFEC5|nr:uncharacterized protein LOC104098018 [Nicotiana tomentosiformis]